MVYVRLFGGQNFATIKGQLPQSTSINHQAMHQIASMALHRREKLREIAPWATAANGVGF